MRLPRTEAGGGPRNWSPELSMESGARGSNPAWIESSRARSATLRAIGPTTPMEGSQASGASVGTRPMLVRKP